MDFYRDLCLKYICVFGLNVRLSLTRCSESHFSYIFPMLRRLSSALSLFIYLTLNHGIQWQSK